MAMPGELLPLALPAEFTPAWVEELIQYMDAASQKGPTALQEVLPASIVVALLGKVEKLLAVEPALIEVCRHP